MGAQKWNTYTLILHLLASSWPSYLYIGLIQAIFECQPHPNDNALCEKESNHMFYKWKIEMSDNIETSIGISKNAELESH